MWKSAKTKTKQAAPERATGAVIVGAEKLEELRRAKAAAKELAALKREPFAGSIFIDWAPA
jgi:hypothetical protein